MPWQGLKAKTDEEKQELVKNMKRSLPAEKLCGGLPDAFARYIKYARSLGFGDKPDYAYLRRLFLRLFTSEGFKYDNIFDWTVKLFNEKHGPKESVAALPQCEDQREADAKRQMYEGYSNEAASRSRSRSCLDPLDETSI